VRVHWAWGCRSVYVRAYALHASARWVCRCVRLRACVRACERACVRACVRACARASAHWVYGAVSALCVHVWLMPLSDKSFDTHTHTHTLATFGCTFDRLRALFYSLACASSSLILHQRRPTDCEIDHHTPADVDPPRRPLLLSRLAAHARHVRARGRRPRHAHLARVEGAALGVRG
jgi:hypothetical protein